MRFSTLSHLKCPRCGLTPSPDEVVGVCVCGSPLLARYDLDEVRDGLSKEQVASRPPDLWRYHELLPVSGPDRKSVV